MRNLALAAIREHRKLRRHLVAHDLGEYALLLDELH